MSTFIRNIKDYNDNIIYPRTSIDAVLGMQELINRLDAIISGSTSDTEVIDARTIGRETYATLHDAINALDSGINMIAKSMAKEVDLMTRSAQGGHHAWTLLGFSFGTIDPTTGEFTSANAPFYNACSGFVDMELYYFAMDSMGLSGYGYTIYLYDISKNYIGYIAPNSNGECTTLYANGRSTSLYSNAVYFRISVGNTNHTTSLTENNLVLASGLHVFNISPEVITLYGLTLAAGGSESDVSWAGPNWLYSPLTPSAQEKIQNMIGIASSEEVEF